NPSIASNLCIPSPIGVFLLGLTHSMSQLVFGIPREYAFLFFHNNWDTAHDTALNGLFVQTLGLLSVDGLITLERVMQDGTKIRAKAAADSFRRPQRIEQALKEAKAQVAAV